MSDTRRHFVFAGGGTGGHLIPGITVARAVRRRQPDAPVTFFTTNRPLDRQLLAEDDFDQVVQPVQPLTTRPWHWPGFLRAWRHSVRQAQEFIRTHKPLAVLGLGGYAAGPPVVAAHRLNMRRAILNPDAIPGRANRYLASRSELVFLQWADSAGRFPSGTRCESVGCPIRDGFGHISPDAGRQAFGLDLDRPVLLATGASQGARTLNLAMQRAWPKLVAGHPEWQLLHLTGPADENATRAAYQAAGVGAHVVAFTHEMPAALAAADVVVSRAGASTLAEISAVGRAAVLLPYPYHRDRHQHANADVLVKAGAAVVVEDQRLPELNSGPLLAAIEPLLNAHHRSAMELASRHLGRADAAERVAAWLLS